MYAMFQMAFGIFVISSVISYLWWVKFRTWIFRQELFAIRDEIWLKACDGGWLDDPEHRRFRRELNSLIRLAPGFNILTLFRFTSPEGLKDKSTLLDYQRPELKQAYICVIRLVCTYLFRWSVAGSILYGSFKIFHASTDLSRRVYELINSARKSEDVPSSRTLGIFRSC